MTNTPPATPFWERQRQRLEALRELYRERGVLVLSPKTLGLWKRREELENEVVELRSRTRAAQQNLEEKEQQYNRARLEDVLKKLEEGA